LSSGFLGAEPKFAEPSARPEGAVLRTAAKLVSDPNNPVLPDDVRMLFNRLFDDAFKPADLTASHIHKIVNDSVLLVEFLQIGKLIKHVTHSGADLPIN